MPAGACLESARRLGASNPPLAGTLAAYLALGGYEQAVWRRSVRCPGSASGGEPGDGFRGSYNRWVGRKAGVGAPAFVMPRESGVAGRESKETYVPAPALPERPVSVAAHRSVRR